MSTSTPGGHRPQVKHCELSTRLVVYEARPLPGGGHHWLNSLVIPRTPSLGQEVVDARMVAKYNFFILEVQKVWIAPSTRQPRTIHHLGTGMLMVAGRTIKLPSKMK